MNAVTTLLSRVLGKIPARGTIMTPSGEETYPIVICNEIMGGPFIVNSLEEMKEIPIQRMLKGCKCTVNEYTIGGVITPTTTYMLKSVPTIPSIERLSDLPWDDEGRILILDIGKYYLANVYFPNSNDALTRLDFKIKFNDKLLAHLKKLETKKPVIVTGDFNVAHQEIDLARPKENIGNSGFTQEERDWMTKFLAAGFKDTFRELHPKEIKYSWWAYRAGARVRNVGWRIDYFCVSENILKNIEQADILPEVLGSDHCPVAIKIK